MIKIDDIKKRWESEMEGHLEEASNWENGLDKQNHHLLQLLMHGVLDIAVSLRYFAEQMQEIKEEEDE